MAESLVMQNHCAEIKIRAERRAGEMLREMDLHGGDRKSKLHDATLKLDDLGINRTQSSRWQSIAGMPEGRGATIDQLKALCKDDKEALDLIDQELTRKPGAPVGNQFASKEHKTNTDNVSNCIDGHKRNESHGNSLEYTLRRLRNS